MFLKRSERHFLLDERHKLIYCPIPKVACSSLKVWMLRNLGIEEPRDLMAVHICAAGQLRLSRLGWRGIRRRLADPSYFKFVFVRSPFSRLVSAYLDKVCSANDIVLDILWQVQHAASPINLCLQQLPRHARRHICRRLRPDVKRGITFREFVEFLRGQNLRKVDSHWRPQYTFLGSTQFDFVGRFEDLEEDLKRICQLRGLPCDIPQRNRTNYRCAENGISYADWSVEQLSNLNAMPSYELFYTPELWQRVAELYGRDLDLFGYRDRNPFDRAGRLVA
jgi:hypothetical protein